ncbi:MAG: N-acetylmuramoyl-L-alanine amidase [Bacillota bacterium]|nr:N-acetylmuramoyl-L-alanine amidase [Bacillota bacterium]MDK2856217.1 N-acetylmuramoyl-L-alanine amidase [Bacillota bacterium]MDK2925290.1 N-acetylmuramoyl-L-alanine amidase [Bacillota bacterium]
MLARYRVFFCCLLSALAIVLALANLPAQAEAGGVKLIINGTPVVPDVPPIFKNNRTLVPLRVISEGLGAQVGWNASTRTVTVRAPGHKISLVIGRSVATLDGKNIKLDAPAIIVKNRTFVPLRFISEALGAEVNWDQKTRTITISSRQAEITAVAVRAEVGREVVAIKGSGRLSGSAIQDGSRVVLKLPKAVLKMVPGSVPVDDGLIQEIKVAATGTEEEPGVEVAIELKEPGPFSISSAPGELLVVLPHRVTRLEYRQVAGAEVLKVATTGRVAYTVQQLAAPDRLVIDLPGTTLGASAPRELEAGTLLTDRVRLGEGAGGVRIVVDQRRVTKYRVTVTPTGLEVHLAAQIIGLSYRSGPGGGEVRIQATGPVEQRELRLTDPERLVFDFPGVILNTAAPVLKVNDATVREVRAGQFAVDPDVARVVVELTAYVSHEVSAGDVPGEIVVKVVSSPVAGRYIAVDAGHGGQEPGAVGPSGLLEKDVNLDIARRLASLLRAAGARVYMVRSGDETVDFRVRPDLANNEGVEAFVSIHCNSFAEASKRGTEVYYYKDGRDGQKLAEAIHAALISALGLPDRGVRTADYNVLRYTKMPAALIEVAFISNPIEEKLLADPAFREKAAQGIFNGIIAYFRNK